MKQPDKQKQQPHIRFVFIVGLALIVVGTNIGVMGLTTIGIILIACGLLYYHKI